MTDLPPSVASLRGAVDLSSLARRSSAPQQPAAPAAGAAPAPGGVDVVVEGTDAGFASILELSNTVPVVAELYAGWSEQSQQLGALLERLVRAAGGRLVLARIDAEANPQLAQAFQADAIPTVAAIVAGRPVSLFQGLPAEEQVQGVLEQLLDLAAQNGVTGSIELDGAEAPAEPEQPPLPPLHQEAFDAIDRGDYPAAIAAYKKAIAQNPADHDAAAGLAQVELLDRLAGRTAAEIRQAAGDAPGDVDAQLAVADLDLSGGHLQDAFDRLLDLFPGLDAAAKDQVRVRLLAYFQVAGGDDPRVAAARRRLTSLLY